MHYQSTGSGAPPIVLVHGFGCDLGDWQLQVTHFAPRHQVVACDLRGHGATPGRAEECSIEHYGGDVAALVANLELPPAVLVGHSMGCRVVLEAARIAPDSVKALVLVDGSRQQSGDPAQAEAAMLATIDATGFPAFAENAFRQMFLRPGPRLDAALERLKRLPPETGRALWARMARWDAQHFEPTLRSLAKPLFVAQSTWIDPRSRRREPLQPGQSTPYLDFIRAAAPSARIEVIPGAGHFTQLEAPQALNRLIEEAAAA